MKKILFIISLFVMFGLTSCDINFVKETSKDAELTQNSTSNSGGKLYELVSGSSYDYIYIVNDVELYGFNDIKKEDVLNNIDKGSKYVMKVYGKYSVHNALYYETYDVYIYLNFVSTLNTGKPNIYKLTN